MDITLDNEQETITFARKMTSFLRSGDVVLLQGDLGAGKSFLSRQIIQHFAGAEIEVPSPTFTLVQTYELPSIEIWHFDLYRLSYPDEVIELGWDEALGQSLMLIEWPDRLGDLCPENYIEIALSLCGVNPDKRTLTMTGYGDMAKRVQELEEELNATA